MRKFWNWVGDEDGKSRTLYLNGIIAEESWFDDDVTPTAFKEELLSSEGDIIVWINSPGGDCIAAAQIYNMLMDYKGNVTVKIDGLAASAASVIAMAGTEVLMSSTSLMMIHNPFTVAIGDSEEMQKAIGMLDEVKVVAGLVCGNGKRCPESLMEEEVSSVGDTHAVVCRAFWPDARHRLRFWLGFWRRCGRYSHRGRSRLFWRAAHETHHECERCGASSNTAQQARVSNSHISILGGALCSLTHSGASGARPETPCSHFEFTIRSLFGAKPVTSGL